MDFQPYLGLARTPDNCIGTPPDGLVFTDTSKSGVFLDDAAEIPLARISPDATAWVKRSAARAGASGDLDADLKAFLGTGFPARRLFTGSLGKKDCTQYVNPVAANVSTLPIHTHNQRGGTLVIRALAMMLSAPVANLTTELYKEGVTAPIKSLTRPVGERSSVNVSVGEPWRMPMDGAKYELRTVLPDGIKVADNQLSCCTDAQLLPGVVANCCSGKANGYIVDLYSQCNYDPLLEQLLEDDRVLKVIGYMLAYQTGYRLLVTPASGSIERSTVVGTDDLSSAAARCRQEYLNRLNWLKAELPKLSLDANGCCFTAARPYGWSRNGVFA